MEFVSPEGLRLDGRRPKELRRLACKLGCLAHADGSAMLQMGNTQVIAAVFGPHEVNRRAAADNERIVVTTEVATAAFSSDRRKPAGRNDRRSAEISRNLKGALEQAIILELAPRSQVDVFVHVVVADGGVLSACINAATLALGLAGVRLRDTLSSCTVAYLESTPLLDSNNSEELGGGAVATVASLPATDVMPLVLVERQLSLETLETVLELASMGAAAISQWMKAQLLEHVKQLALCKDAALQ